jgi:formate hydrogenlyase subunit 6/NADH:ubiquinone oxidoreductase subunit I
MLPKITVDNSICLGPFDCGQCLQACPMTIFIAGATKVWKFRETDRKDYQVYARYYDQCVTCYKCVETCPVEAITVSAEEGAALASAESQTEQPAPLD